MEHNQYMRNSILSFQQIKLYFSMDKLLRIMILLLLIVSTLQRSTPEITHLEIYMGILLLCVFFTGMIVFFLNNETLNIPIVYLFAFTAWALAGIFIALSNNVTLAWWFRRYLPVFTLAMITLSSMVAFRTEREIRQIYIILVVLGLLVVCYSGIKIYSVNITSIKNLQSLRKYGGGYFAVFSLALILPFMFYGEKLKKSTRYLIIGCVSVLFFSLIISFTRTYWLSIFTAFCFMIYLLIRVRNLLVYPYHIMNIVNGVLIITIILLLIPNNLRSFVIGRFISIPLALSDVSFSDRIWELGGMWNSIMENPVSLLIGNGLGAKYRFYSVNPWSWGGIGWVENDYSHNYYAYILWSTGFIGLSLFLLFWGSLLHRGLKLLFLNHHASIAGLEYFLIGIFTAIINLLVASLTTAPLVNMRWAVYYGILLGLTLSLTRLIHNKSIPSDLTNQIRAYDSNNG